VTDWLTSDTHFNHRNIILYCSRPYFRDGKLDVEWMNRDMIARWNARVQPRDTVYHLGDFAMGLKEEIPGIRRKLNGRIILIRGNHDRSPEQMRAYGFDEVHEEGVLPLGKNGLEAFLHHQPVYDFDDKRHHVHFCGHVHERWASRRSHEGAGAMIINVGVDQNEFQPITVHEALQRRLKPSVNAGWKLLACRACRRVEAREEFFEFGCPKCHANDVEPVEPAAYDENSR
jgi:calcineurin-like phosphoesterase family protein